MKKLKGKHGKAIKLPLTINSPFLRYKNRKKIRKTNTHFKKISKIGYSHKSWSISLSDCRHSSSSSLKIGIKTPKEKRGHNFSMDYTDTQSVVSVVNSTIKSVEKTVCTPNEVNTIKSTTYSNYKPFIFKMPKDKNVNDVFENRFINARNKTIGSSLMSLVSPKNKFTARLAGPDIFEENHSNLTENTNGLVSELEKSSCGATKGKQQKIKMSRNVSSNIFFNMCSLLVNSSCKENVAVNIYELTLDQCLVIMKPTSYFYFVGIVEVELLKGAIEILGYTLHMEKQKVMIFSSQGSSHLFIKARDSNGQSQPISEKVICERLFSFGLTEKIVNKILKEAKNNTLFIIRRKQSHISTSVWPSFFEKYFHFSLFPSVDLLSEESRPCHRIEHKLECLFEGNLQTLGLKAFNQIAEWSVIEDELISADFPKVVLCGGKSVGKSTLLRFLINKLLHKWNSVLVIDFDLGQCEFTVPGCIYISLVQEPVLGPNFSHLKEPLRCVFLGEVDVTKCPEHYIEGCKLLIDCAREEYGKIPWLINTMGFTKGFGVTLTCGIIRNIVPTHVIQIESKNQKLNFPSQLDPGFVFCQNVGSFGNENKHFHYKLYKVPSASEVRGSSSPKQRTMLPAAARNLVILSYFSELLSSEMTSLSQVIPYMISMDLIELRITDKYNLNKTQVAATMIGNMVALCHLGEDGKFPNCLGFGIVRGIDWVANNLFLITPVSQQRLGKINCLIKGSVALPESLYYKKEHLTGHIPYLAMTSTAPTARFAKRDFRSLPVTVR